MKQNLIIIDQENFTRAKKRLKNQLKRRGINFSLSDVANMLAQTFGFKNENEMQNFYFKSEQHNLELTHVLNCKSDNLNTIIFGKTDQGKTISIKKIKKSLLDNTRLLSFETFDDILIINN